MWRYCGQGVPFGEVQNAECRIQASFGILHFPLKPDADEGVFVERVYLASPNSVTFPSLIFTAILAHCHQGRSST